MRALIMASVSRAMVIEPASTSFTKFFTRSLPRSFVDSSRVRRPCSRIESRTLCSLVVVAAAACWVACFPSGIGFLHLRAKLVHLFLVRYAFLQHFIQLVVALQRSAPVRQLGPQVQQLAQRLHLARHIGGLEIFHALEAQVHSQPGGVG